MTSDLFAKDTAEGAIAEAREQFGIAFHETLHSPLLDWQTLENATSGIRMRLHSQLGMSRYNCPHRAMAADFDQYIDEGIGWIMDNKPLPAPWHTWW